MSDQPNTARPLPAALAQVVEDFNDLGIPDRLQLLLEFSDGLPPLPQRYVDHPELLEPVPECQSPIFLLVEVDGDDEDAVVHLFFSAPPEAPTTRGFAGILHEGLDGLSAADVLAVPMDVTEQLGLGDAVSMLRLRGMAAMLARIKRQVQEKVAA
ncbi:MAG: SufE family protein [Propionibacteriaceae bacterium]|nr:SufE family protein [Propionibacteriaceae bacterium]